MHLDLLGKGLQCLKMLLLDHENQKYDFQIIIQTPTTHLTHQH